MSVSAPVQIFLQWFTHLPLLLYNLLFYLNGLIKIIQYLQILYSNFGIKWSYIIYLLIVQNSKQKLSKIEGFSQHLLTPGQTCVHKVHTRVSHYLKPSNVNAAAINDISRTKPPSPTNLAAFYKYRQKILVSRLPSESSDVCRARVGKQEVWFQDWWAKQSSRTVWRATLLRLYALAHSRVLLH